MNPKNCNSVYIHIPFCSNICNYCDFCKMYYNEKLVDDYLQELNKEIKTNYKNETLSTIYIGGGTPSCLNIEQLSKLFNITSKLNLNNKYEFTIEMNINDITEEKLKLFKENKVNRISIGIETLNDKYLTILNRKHTKEEVIAKLKLAKRYFNNINIDLMYAFPKETLKDLDKDLSFIKEIDVPHVSIYSLIIEEHTKLFIDKTTPIDDELESKMYYHIIEHLKNLGYNHYEISNFSKEGYESRHNLTYWNNLEYYGFGLGSSGYINNIRYTNTRSINNYLKGNYILEKTLIDTKTKMENFMMLGLRKTEGISKKEFKDIFSSTISENFDIINLLDKKLLIDDNEYLKIPENLLYIENSILVNFIDGGGND